MILKYNIVLKKNEEKKIVLPNLKTLNMVLQELFIEYHESPNLLLRLTSPDSIINIGEAVLVNTQKFSLDNYKTSLISSERLELSIKNLANVKQNTVDLTVSYTRVEDNIILNNIYYQLDNEQARKQLLEDIQKAGKYLHRIVMIDLTEEEEKASKKMTVTLEPAFLPEDHRIFPRIDQTVDKELEIEITDNDNSVHFPPEAIEYLPFYNFCTNAVKLGLVVYGFK